ncbi:hypothetical protein FFWV33_10490 [Flavobacterium faecale]|uniref:Uncharacterized protein n=1 Tax=Flavobacterium faecale TaxID=1355330 RepID=A0A2S1LE16_9FLAO|nr:hypothetical protein FFWV33_10490 [Flavobacterium faecale]
MKAKTIHFNHLELKNTAILMQQIFDEIKWVLDPLLAENSLNLSSNNLVVYLLYNTDFVVF